MTWHNMYFLPEEVSNHNTYQDCWLVIHRVVKNVTGLVEEFRDTNLIYPILKEAGKDVSNWFEYNGTDISIKSRLHPETAARVSALPFRLPHESIFEPDINWMPNTDTTPWWRDEKYNVGMETVRPVNIRVLNPHIKKCASIMICLEDTVRRIIERYSVYNSEMSSYMVKYLGKPLNEDWDLSRNCVLLKHDDSVDDYVPTLMLYYQEKLAPCGDVPP